jgi:hypothetical protein
VSVGVALSVSGYNLVSPCGGSQRAQPAQRRDRDRDAPQPPRQVDDPFEQQILLDRLDAEVRAELDVAPHAQPSPNAHPTPAAKRPSKDPPPPTNPVTPSVTDRHPAATIN